MGPLVKRVLLAASFSFLLFLRYVLGLRFQQLREERIGHASADVEILLSRFDTGNLNPKLFRKTIWIGSRLDAANSQLWLLWRRQLRTFDSKYLKLAHKYLEQRYLPSVSLDFRASDRDLEDVLIKTRCHFSLDADGARQARLLARSILGLAETDSWVVLVNRDTGYLRVRNPQRDWSYHDYRNSDIAKYLLAAEFLADQGLKVVRMGTNVEAEMPSLHPGVIDYAGLNVNNPLLDLYLVEKCLLMISNGTGLDSLARSYRRPQLYVNLTPLSGIYVEQPCSMHILKNFVDVKTNQFLSHSEIYERGLESILSSAGYESSDSLLVENSSEDIYKVTREFYESFTRKWQFRPLSAKQLRFWELYRLHPDWHPPVIRTRIGEDFLMSYPHWTI